MTKLETLFKEQCFESGLNEYQYKTFKKEHPNLYKALMQSLHNVSLKTKGYTKDFILVNKDNIRKITLQNDKPKTFIYGGCFMFEDREVVLLENTDTMGTFYIENASILRQLKHYQIGLKIRLIKHNEGINMVLPHDLSNKIGLFEDI